MIGIAATEPSHGDCPYSQQAAQHGVAAVEMAPLIACKAHAFFHDWAEGLIAVGTLVLAVFTGTLWNATRNLLTSATDLIPFAQAIPLQHQETISKVLQKYVAQTEALKNGIPTQVISAEVVFPDDPIERLIEFVVPLGPGYVSPSDPNTIFNGPLLMGGFFYRSTFNKESKYTTFAYALMPTRAWPVLDGQQADHNMTRGAVYLHKWMIG